MNVSESEGISTMGVGGIAEKMGGRGAVCITLAWEEDCSGRLISLGLTSRRFLAGLTDGEIGSGEYTTLSSISGNFPV